MSDSAKTQGGRLGHVVRRFIHVSMISVPWIYYQFGAPRHALWGVMVLVVLLESWRFSRGVLLFGQRANESRRISAFAWGSVSLCIVLLSTTPSFAYPIIASCALADPLMGELRRRHWSAFGVALSGVLMVAVLWGLAVYWMGVPGWWLVVMPPLTVLAEWPNFRWVDDNGVMLLVPLLIIMG